MRQIDTLNIWNTTLTIELTLKELQFIYNSVGCSNHRLRMDLWKQYNDDKECCYGVGFGDGVYDELEDLIEKNGGVVH